MPSSVCETRSITALPATFALSAAQASAYTPLHNAFVAAYNALTESREAGNRSESLTATKDGVKIAA